MNTSVMQFGLVTDRGAQRAESIGDCPIVRGRPRSA
jgi:hypothetical protein